jgi:hypothetical protein
MPYAHPAFMAALWLAGLYVAATGGPARMLKLKATGEPEIARRHDLSAEIFAILVAAGYGGGLLTVYLLRPGLLFHTVHFQVGTLLMGLLAIVVGVAFVAERGRRWAVEAHAFLAVVLLLLFLVQAMLGLQLLAIAPSPPPADEAQAVDLRSSLACPGQVRPAVRLDKDAPLNLKPQPDESAPLKPHYAICPKAFALPALSWVVET